MQLKFGKRNLIKIWGGSLLKVTGGAWGTPVMGTPILKKTLQFRNCSELEAVRYKTCFKIYLKCQCRTVYVVKSEKES